MVVAISPLSSPSRGDPEMLAQRRKPQRTSLQGGGGVTGMAGGTGRGRGDKGHSLLVALQPAQALAPAVPPLRPLHVQLLVAEALGRAWQRASVTCSSPPASPLPRPTLTAAPQRVALTVPGFAAPTIASSLRGGERGQGWGGVRGPGGGSGGWRGVRGPRGGSGGWRGMMRLERGSHVCTAGRCCRDNEPPTCPPQSWSQDTALAQWCREQEPHVCTATGQQWGLRAPCSPQSPQPRVSAWLSCGCDC